jgi:hypothetical protein
MQASSMSHECVFLIIDHMLVLIEIITSIYMSLLD